MLDFFQRLFESDFTPHGQAYLMRPEIIWLHVVSDGLIALAYLLVLITLAYFLRKRSDLPHRGMFVLFGFFVLACAVAHLLEIWSVWHGTFRLVGVVKAVTGLAAVATAVMLAKLVPEALALPAPEDLEQANLALARERSERAGEQSSWSRTQEELGRRIDEGSAELRGVKGELAGELSDSDRLQEHGSRLFAKTELRPLLEEIVTGMIALRNADLGSLQLYNLETGAPEVAAHQGLQQDALESLDGAFKKSGTWEETLRAGKCVLIEDVLTDPGFEPHLAIAASVGFRAMQMTPLRNRDGDLLGFGSLYFRQPRKFVERDSRMSLHYARLATEMIEARRAEIARTQGDLHVRRLIRGLNEYGLFMLDPAGRIVIWNLGARCVTGFDADEIVGKHFSALFEPHQLELEKPGEAVRRAVADGRFEDQSLRSRKDGTPYWSHLVLTPLNDDAGDLRGFAGIIQDITARKRAEDELRRSEAFLAEAQRLSRTGSWGWKISTGEIHWSSETFRLFGVNPRDVKPSYQLFLQFVHPEDKAYVERAFDEAAREKTELKADFRIVLSDGSVKHVRNLGYPAPEGSALADYVGAISDISEQKLAEEAFRNAQAEFPRIARLTIDEYATSIAKEIGQSLDAIASNADFCFRLAEATRALPFEAREPLLNIVKDANRVNEVVSRARQQTARSARNKVPLEVGDVVLDVLALSSRDLRRNRITVKTELGENLPIISADRIELQQVLLNLVLNAIEAMSEQPDERRVLTIRTTKEPLEDKDAVRIDVQDCGVGFSSEQEDRMFDAFYSTKPNNTGMGLRISRSIVEAHAGRLLASTNADSGATFSCILPAS